MVGTATKVVKNKNININEWHKHRKVDADKQKVEEVQRLIIARARGEELIVDADLEGRIRVGQNWEKQIEFRGIRKINDVSTHTWYTIIPSEDSSDDDWDSQASDNDIPSRVHLAPRGRPAMIPRVFHCSKEAGVVKSASDFLLRKSDGTRYAECDYHINMSRDHRTTKVEGGVREK